MDSRCKQMPTPDTNDKCLTGVLGTQVRKGGGRKNVDLSYNNIIAVHSFIKIMQHKYLELWRSPASII